jgi:hypothetical protein
MLGGGRSPRLLGRTEWLLVSDFDHHFMILQPSTHRPSRAAQSFTLLETAHQIAPSLAKMFSTFHWVAPAAGSTASWKPEALDLLQFSYHELLQGTASLRDNPTTGSLMQRPWL